MFEGNASYAASLLEREEGIASAVVVKTSFTISILCATGALLKVSVIPVILPARPRVVTASCVVKVPYFYDGRQIAGLDLYAAIRWPCKADPGDYTACFTSQIPSRLERRKEDGTDIATRGEMSGRLAVQCTIYRGIREFPAVPRSVRPRCFTPPYLLYHKIIILI